MQPHSRSIFDLFDGKKRYVVPLFQRQYVWNRDNQWEPLWEDIQRKLVERLTNKNGPPHFLGAMVIDQKRFYGDEVPTHLVIDGQQRLATFQVFLAVLRDVCTECNQQALADECQQYLINVGLMAEPEVEKYKVWPTRLDRDQFKVVIDSRSRADLEKRHPLRRIRGTRKFEPRPLMVECYLFFHEQIQDFLTNPDFSYSVEEKLKRLYQALRGSLQVVTIELEGQDDPQVIFETLNARGQPLLPSDLLRNYIFWRATQNEESQERLYEKYWVAFDDEFWRKEEKQGRLLRPRCDLFMQHYLAFKRKEEINIGHLFAEYKHWIGTAQPFDTVEKELDEMAQHRDFFRRLIEPDPGTRLGLLARTLQVFDTRTVYPLLLALLDRGLPVEVLDGIFTDLESYVLRRSVCGLTTKNYNRVFLAILSKLPNGDLTRATFRTIVLELQGESSVWPRDEDFRKAWLESPVYDDLDAGRVELMLRRIEEQLQTAKSEVVDIKSALTVEHILPVGWREKWPLQNGHRGVPWEERFGVSADNAPEDPIERAAADRATAEKAADVEASYVRDRLLHTFGNLSLLTQPFNSSLSNDAYAVKQPEIVRQSALALNRYFHDVLTWDESQILARGEELFKHARVIWPHGE